jgi:hypothetical protein
LDSLCPGGSVSLLRMKTCSVQFEAVETAINSLGLAPFQPGELSEEELYNWLISPRIPVWVSEEPFTREIIHAIFCRDMISFFYMDGSRGCEFLTISPDLVFRLTEEGPEFLSGYCHDRGENRVLRLDQVIESAIRN